jgi:hypothetical protein
MKKTGKFPLVIFLISASLLAACGQAAAPIAEPSTPAVASVPPAAQTSVPAATSPAPTATPSPEPTVTPPADLGPSECKLLSWEDIGKVLGGPIVFSYNQTNGNTIYCLYQTKDLQLALIFIDPTGNPEGSEGVMQEARKNASDPFTIPGLGDDAFVDNFNGNVGLTVRKGDSVNSIGLLTMSAGGFGNSPDNALETEKALAELLISALP